MKILGILIALAPTLIYSAPLETTTSNPFENSVFYLDEEGEEFLTQIEYESEDIECFHRENHELGSETPIFEAKDSPSQGLCEALDLAAEEEISNFVEKRASEINDEYEEIMGYNFPTRNKVAKYTPSLERVPENRKNLIGSRPKVVEDDSKEGRKGQKEVTDAKSVQLASKKSEKKGCSEEAASTAE